MVRLGLCRVLPRFARTGVPGSARLRRLTVSVQPTIRQTRLFSNASEQSTLNLSPISHGPENVLSEEDLLGRSVQTDDESDRPTRQQLKQIALASMIPFIGFGFMDNFIMIIAGDAIDATLGITFGLSTMAAAGIGNLISDVIGVWAGDVIEDQAKKFGIEEPDMSDEAYETSIAKAAKSISGALGISIGCILGMCPLLWISNNKDNFMTDEEMAVYQKLFAKHGVEVKSFIALARKARWRNYSEGDVIVEGDAPLSRVILLTSGSAEAFRKDETYPCNIFSGKREEEEIDDCRGSLMRGPLVGSSRLVDYIRKPAVYDMDKAMQYTVKVAEPSRGLEWDFKELIGAFAEDEEDKAMERAIVQISSHELLRQAKQMRAIMKRQASKQGMKVGLEEYEILMKATLCDGVIDQAERDLLQKHRDSCNLSREDHLKVLAKFNWTEQDWEHGRKQSP